MKQALTIFLGIIGATALLGNVQNGIVDSVLDNLEWSFGKVTFELKPLKIIVRLPIRITNNNFSSVTVETVKGKLIYGTADLGDISINAPVELLRGDEVETTAILEAMWLSLGSEITDLITAGDFLGTIRFQGELVTSLGTIPLDENIPIEALA